jgi:putative membrane-bound dehydrogenase-like protein
MKPSKLVPVIVAICVCAAYGAEESSSKEEYLPPPKSPAESLAAIQTSGGFKVDLVAAEPLIVDPVAIDWGPDGKLWVVEMRDYPMGMDGNWKPGSRIKFLEDTNGDGIYDKATVFLDNLPFATGVTAWRKGALVCTAPDILYAECTKGGGYADHVEKLFTGFATGNYQARVNSLSLGLDNWIYGANGLLGGIIQGEARGIAGQGETRSRLQEVDIRGRDFRVNPDTGLFEPESGLTQQGRARDDWGNWFGCDNSIAAWHYPIHDHYLRRNPYVVAPTPRIAIAAGVNGNLLYPISRTLERFNSPGSVNRVTSGCGIGVYRDSLFGNEFYGNLFLCEPVHNLVHRMVLEPDGLTFKAVRAANEQKSEFLASKDNWFRPVQMRTGPDGAIWVVDMYRFVIEHPRWIPPDRLAKLDVRAGDDKGRIYRVYPKGQKLRPIMDLTKLSSAKLAGLLDTANGMERDRIHQELVFGQTRLVSSKGERHAADRKTVNALEQIALKSKVPAARLQAFCVLDGLAALRPDLVQQGLADRDAGVRANAIRLTEKFTSAADRNVWAGPFFRMADDPSLSVRYQLALTLGEWDDPRSGEVLGKLASADVDDEWMRAAILSSAAHQSAEILNTVLAVQSAKPERGELISQLIATAAGEGKTESLDKIAAVIAPADADEKRVQAWQLNALDSLLDALERKGVPLSDLPAQARLKPLFDQASTLALDTNAKESARDPAIRLLGRRPATEAKDLELLAHLLEPSVPTQLQKTALNTLKRNHSSNVADLLLSAWNGLPFSLRPGAIEVLLSRDEWTKRLLAAVEENAVGKNELSLAHRQHLLKSKNKEIVEAAAKIWPANPSGNRAEVVAKYRSALSLAGNPLKGRDVWVKNCVTCHYFRGQGSNVGPNLGALTDKSPEDFLVAILDPNAAVEPRFVAYNIETRDGRTLSGVVNAETATTLTLVQSGGTSEKILRSDIAQMRASGLSLMPEGLEQNMTPQDLADLISYLNSGAHPFGTATPEKAEAARKRFLALGNNGAAKILSEGKQEAHAGWMGESPVAWCRQTAGQNRLAWQTVSAPADLKPTDSYDFRVPVSMGSGGGPPGRFSLLLNGKPALDFDVALHDQTWHSTDGKVQASYLAMEDSPQESNGILTVTVSGSLLEPGKPTKFEVTGTAANSKRWFGIYLVRN